jgi:hypothetical protein
MNKIINEIMFTRFKIGDGSDNNPYRPDMDGIICRAWGIIEERENEYDVMVFDYVVPEIPESDD